MPNWTTNKIKMKNIVACDDLFSVNDRGEKYFDFNKLIPEPKTKNECPTKYLDDGTKYLEHSDGRDWFNWLDWRRDFWRTKWNSCDTQFISNDEIQFDTAWNCPMPIFETLAKKYKDREIIVEWEDEDDWDTVHRRHFNFEED